ncbi:phage major capsid protein [uncultured Porphyromonas sp.]|uniref:phage major capsid protein n=1 Tax=uncultured Porphyromonas sp. TaxID=159274 RepID=UPI00262BCC28|nr:phage major capsid protein [uncultured Porphyromonas sp.]
MTKEQEQLHELHVRFKELQSKRHAGSLTEDEERELVQVSEDIQERSINAVVSKALEHDSTAIEAECAKSFIDAAARAMSSRQTVAIEERAATMTSNVDAAKPVIIQDILEPLEAELIHTKLGLKMQTGVVGQPVWPVLAGVTATIAGEDVALSDQNIDLSKISAKSERVGVYVPVTSQAINATNKNLRKVVLSRLGKAVGKALNLALFAKTAPVAPHDGIGSILASPYATPMAGSWSNTVKPTLTEITDLEGEVLGKEVEADGSTAYFVHPKTYSLLKSTPVEKGTSTMLLVDGRMNGYPVVSTTFMPHDAILFGTLSYAVIAQYGDGDRMAAQYDGKKDRVDFTLNGDYSLTVLRAEAFACLKRKA